MPALDPTLQLAYERTHYRLGATPPVSMRIGQADPVLDALLLANQARGGLFVSAWNPRSRPLTSAENARRHAVLIADLSAHGLRWLDALGVDPDGVWPAEQSVFVFDADLTAAGVSDPGADIDTDTDAGIDACVDMASMADRLMSVWDQNAVVQVRLGKAPVLVLHPDLRRGPDE